MSFLPQRGFPVPGLQGQGQQRCVAKSSFPACLELEGRNVTFPALRVISRSAPDLDSLGTRPPLPLNSCLASNVSPRGLKKPLGSGGAVAEGFTGLRPTQSYDGEEEHPEQPQQWRKDGLVDGGHVDLLVEFGRCVRVVHVIAVCDMLHAQVQQPWGPGDRGTLRGCFLPGACAVPRRPQDRRVRFRVCQTRAARAEGGLREPHGADLWGQHLPFEPLEPILPVW